MKLHAIQDRSNSIDQARKRGGDAWDIHQLLTHLDADRSVRADLGASPSVLRELVYEALERLFVARRDLTANWLREIPQAEGVTGDELAVVAEPVLDAIRSSR